MARAKGEGTISKRPDGSWCGRITLGYDENGKQLRKAFYGKTRKEVVNKMDAAKAELNRTTRRDFSDATVSEWVDFWLDEYKKRTMKVSSYHVLKDYFRVYVKPMLGDIQLQDLKPQMVQMMANQMVDEGLSSSTVTKSVNSLRAALTQAIKNGFIRRNAASNVTCPPNPRKEARALTVDEQERFVAAAKSHPNGDLILLLLATGLRIGEATALTWADVDFDKGSLHINKTDTQYYDPNTKQIEYVVHTPKTAAGVRDIPVLPAVMDLLKQRFPKSYSPSDPVFWNSNSPGTQQKLRRFLVADTLRQIREKAAISDNVHLHTLRHTFATRGLESGIELKVIQELLGHTNIGITADTYTHVLPDKKKESMMKLADTIAMPEGRAMDESEQEEE